MSNGYGQGDFQPDKLMTASEAHSRGVPVLGAAGAMNSPKQTPAMDSSMRTLGQNIERLAQAIQVLSGKIEPVLYSEPPSPHTTAAVETRAPRASSNLGASINSYADQIESLTDRVNSLTRRCEL